MEGADQHDAAGREGLLTAVVETAQNAFVVIDTEGRVTWWNRAAERILGWPREEAVGRVLGDLIIPEPLRQAHADGVARRSAGEPPRLGPDPLQLVAVRRDGAEIDVEVTFGELHWQGDRRFHAFIRDITERESARRALEASEARFRLTFAHAPVGMVLTDLTEAGFGRLVAVNPAVQDMLGYREPELLSMSLADLSHPDDAHLDDEMVRQLLTAASGTVQYEKRFVCADGHTMWVSLSASVVRAPDGSALHTITQLVDVTAARAHADELARLNRQLADANAELATVNSDLDTFAATVAHDLKNPLAALAGMAEILQWEPDRPARDATAVRSISRTTQRMLAMVDDLLAYSRAGRAEMSVERVDLEAMVGDLAAELRHAEGPPVHLTHDHLPALHAQPVLLRQVLDNLVGNAVKYVEPGVTPRVHLSAVEDTDGGGWTVRVADNGIGIPAEARDRVFTMFHREASGPYQGSGIGLATCRRIVERHGGRIWVEDNPSGGSVVCLWLPSPAPG